MGAYCCEVLRISQCGIWADLLAVRRWLSNSHERAYAFAVACSTDTPRLVERPLLLGRMRRGLHKRRMVPSKSEQLRRLLFRHMVPDGLNQNLAFSGCINVFRSILPRVCSARLRMSNFCFVQRGRPPFPTLTWLRNGQ